MMTTAKEYTIPELTYGGSKHSGKVLVDRADYYASMAREAVLQARVAKFEEFLAFVKRAPVSSGCCQCGSTEGGCSGHDYMDAWDYNLGLFVADLAACATPATTKLQPWVCALCDQQHMDGEVCVEAMARNGVEQ